MVTHVSSGALIINHAAMVSSGGMVSTLCITTGNNELASANLLHIFPNPVSQSTVISFSINQSENISVNIYDITGRFIKNLYDGSLNPGNHQIEWTVTSESEIDDGVYFLNIKGGGFSQSCKLLVLK